MVELVDTQDLKSCVLKRRAGSSPASGTKTGFEMKKLSVVILFAASLAVTACHYGQNEAKETLERNEQYKNENQDYSVNRAGEGGKMNESAPATEAPAEPAAPADSTANSH